jgi:hypothetical protein
MDRFTDGYPADGDHITVILNGTVSVDDPGVLFY